MSRRQRSVFQHLKDWWWLYGVGATLCSFIVLWGGIPNRLAKAEETVSELKDWAKELQGYTRAQQEFNQRQQQAAPRPLPPVEYWVDGEGRRWECDPGRYDCANNDNWMRMP